MQAGNGAPSFRSLASFCWLHSILPQSQWRFLLLVELLFDTPEGFSPDVIRENAYNTNERRVELPPSITGPEFRRCAELIEKCVCMHLRALLARYVLMWRRARGKGERRLEDKEYSQENWSEPESQENGGKQGVSCRWEVESRSSSAPACRGRNQPAIILLPLEGNRRSSSVFQV